MANYIRITSKRDGFRRAGMTHPATAVDHPAEDITPEQFAILVAEPMLVVQELEIPDVSEPGDSEKEGKAGKAKLEGK